MNLYEFRSYKDYLRALLKKQAVRGYVSALARSAGCTHSYLSQILNAKPHLTPDQAVAISDFLDHDEDEAEYFLNLVTWERAATERLRARMERKLKAMRDRKISVAGAVEKSVDSALGQAERDFYYAHWRVGAVHLLTACDDYQTAEAIGRRLALPSKEVEAILTWLLGAGLVRVSGKKFLHSGKNVHLPTECVHNYVNHLNWRLKALESTGQSDAVHYTAAFAISRGDWERLRADLVGFIEKQRKQIGGSGSEEAFTFCCDLFRI